MSEIVNSYRPEDVSHGDLTQTIEESILDVTEFPHFSEEEADQNKRAYEVNRYYLDLWETDYLRNFMHRFEAPIFPTGPVAV